MSNLPINNQNPLATASAYVPPMTEQESSLRQLGLDSRIQSQANSLSLLGENSQTRMNNLSPNATTEIVNELANAITNILLSFIDRLISMISGKTAPKANTADSPASESETPAQAASIGSLDAEQESASSTPLDNVSTAAQTSATDGNVREATESDILPDERSSTSSTKASANDLQTVTDDQGAVTILTDDGYTIRCEGQNEAWTITGKNGKTTRIWGDPHVVESDGDKWDFQKRASLVFGDNKITVETKPLANGKALTQKITVYNGDERVSVSDIDKNKPRILAAANDALIHDAELADGNVFKLSHEPKSRDEEWIKEKA